MAKIFAKTFIKINKKTVSFSDFGQNLEKLASSILPKG